MKALSFPKSHILNLEGAPNGWFLSVTDEPEVQSRGVRSGHGSTSAGAGHDPVDHGENGHDKANGESHEASLLALPPPPPPPPMTPAEMMVEVFAA
jgi:hypothetical protein